MPNFNRRHYETVALALAQARKDAQTLPNGLDDPCTAIAYAATRLADAFARDNENFNRIRTFARHALRIRWGRYWFCF